MVKVQAGFFGPPCQMKCFQRCPNNTHTQQSNNVFHHSLGWRAKKMSLTESCKQHTNVAIFVLMCNKKENDGGCVCSTDITRGIYKKVS